MHLFITPKAIAELAALKAQAAMAEERATAHPGATEDIEPEPKGMMRVIFKSGREEVMGGVLQGEFEALSSCILAEDLAFTISYGTSDRRTATIIWSEVAGLIFKLYETTNVVNGGAA